MKVLGIETSCDETAAAVVSDRGAVLSNVVHSQIPDHRPYGGVVPEIASRRHIEMIGTVVERALSGARVGFKELDAIAVTRGPGLMGSLLVGLSLGKAIAFARGIPLVGVNHLMGHVYSIFIEYPRLALPLLTLVVSGGHTAIYFVRGPKDFELLGQTRDDAAGEALDKLAKLLRLGYPGGKIIDSLSKKGDPEAISFPRAMISSRSLDFSFSGLKTAALLYLKEKALPPLSEAQLHDLVASFQEALVDVLVEKTLSAAKKKEAERVVVTGGVASNSRLREKMLKRLSKEGLSVYFPSQRYCTDNAAMIAVAGVALLKEGVRDPLDLDAYSRGLG